MLAGKPSAVVCALPSTNWTDVAPRNAGAFVRYAEQTAYFPRWVCGQLEGRAKPLDPEWARSLLAFTHEVQHLRGERNEATAECFALKDTARVAILYFGVRGRAVLHRMMDLVMRAHYKAPLNYRGNC